MRLDDAATDREAQPRSAVGPAARSVGAVKPFEQMRHRLRRDPRIRILDHNAYLPGVAARDDPHATPGIGIAQRVLEQVAERLGQPVAVGEYPGRRKIRLDAEPPLVEPLYQGLHRLLQELRDLDGLLAVGKRADVGE